MTVYILIASIVFVVLQTLSVLAYQGRIIKFLWFSRAMDMGDESFFLLNTVKAILIGSCWILVIPIAILGIILNYGFDLLLKLMNKGIKQ